MAEYDGEFLSPEDEVAALREAIENEGSGNVATPPTTVPTVAQEERAFSTSGFIPPVTVVKPVFTPATEYESVDDGFARFWEATARATEEWHAANS